MIRPLLQYVMNWQNGSVHRKILSAAAIVAFFSFAAKVLGAAKEIFVARQFGTSADVDAFLIAMIVPSFVISILGTALNYALMPAYIAVRQRDGPEAAQRLLSTVMALSLVVLLATAAILGALMPFLLPLVSHRFTSSETQLTAELSYLLLPTIVLAGTTTTWSAILNAHDRFASPAAAALAVPLVSVVGVVLLAPTWGIRALATATLGGYFVETLVVAAAVKREGLSLIPSWGGATPALRQVARELGPAAAAMLFTAVNPVIDQVMAARLGPGSVASLGYGNKLVAFIAGVGSVSLASAVAPHFSKLAAAENWGVLRNTIKSYTIIIAAISVLVTGVTIALSTPVVRLLYQRGAFTPGDTIEVARIQALYAVQIPFRMTSLLFVRFIITVAANRALMLFSTVNAAVNIAGDVVFSRYFGTAGIALSTSLVCAVSCGMNAWFFRRRIRAYLSKPAVVALPRPA